MNNKTKSTKEQLREMQKQLQALASQYDKINDNGRAIYAGWTLVGKQYTRFWELRTKMIHRANELWSISGYLLNIELDI